jgi:hypothetical protein
VLSPKFLLFAIVLASGTVHAQEPQVKVNVLNVCTPSADEQSEMAAALAKIPRSPQFGPDFEVSRGRSTLSDTPEFLKMGAAAQLSSDSATSAYVRVRQEFPPKALFSTVQYSFSQDSKNLVETLVLRLRDVKDLIQVSIEDSAAAVTSPATMLSTSTPVSRVKLERFGKSSVVLARCQASPGAPAPDQSAYEPLFRSANSIMSDYRGLLGARRMVPDELARVNATQNVRTKSIATPNKPASPLKKEAPHQ